MNNPVIMHCNYAEQGQSIDRMCELAAKWGFDGVEFRQRRYGVTEEPEAYLDTVATAAKKHRIKHVLFGAPGADLMQTPDHCRKEIDRVIAFFRSAAKRFQLTVNNTMAGNLSAPDVPYYMYEKHGSAIATDTQWQQAIEGYKILGDLANELKFKFAFETHNVYLHDLPQPARRLVDAIDRESVGVNLDMGNIVLYPVNPPTLEQSMEILKGKIHLLHLKNMYVMPGMTHQKYLMCPLSDGVINNRQWLSIAKAQGYTGPVVIEAPRAGDREWFAPQDLAYIRSVMADL